MYFNYKMNRRTAMSIFIYAIKNPLLILYEPISYFQIFLIQLNFIKCVPLY